MSWRPRWEWKCRRKRQRTGDAPATNKQVGTSLLVTDPLQSQTSKSTFVESCGGYLPPPPPKTCGVKNGVLPRMAEEVSYGVGFLV